MASTSLDCVWKLMYPGGLPHGIGETCRCHTAAEVRIQPRSLELWDSRPSATALSGPHAAKPNVSHTFGMYIYSILACLH